MLYIRGWVDGKPFQREWTIGEVIPNILVEDVDELQASDDEFKYVEGLFERTDSTFKEFLCFSTWKGEDAKLIWGMILKNNARLIKKGDEGIGPNGELSIDLQCLAQGHSEIEVRKVWLAWKRARDYASRLVEKLAKIKKVLDSNDESNEG